MGVLGHFVVAVVVAVVAVNLPVRHVKVLHATNCANVWIVREMWQVAGRWQEAGGRLRQEGSTFIFIFRWLSFLTNWPANNASHKPQQKQLATLNNNNNKLQQLTTTAPFIIIIIKKKNTFPSSHSQSINRLNEAFNHWVEAIERNCCLRKAF